MATPADRRGRAVDERALERFTERLDSAGVHGLFPASSIGEFPSLTADQHATVVETVTAAASAETTVFAGCCGTAVDDVLAKAELAADAGADAAVVVVPYYLGTDQAGLTAFFEAVADDAALPVVLYNIPALTGIGLDAETVAGLATHEGIAGLKDTSGDLTYLHRVLATTPEDFSLFQGATDLAAASLDLGADGLIAGPANVFPAALADLYDAHATGDHDAVRRLTRAVVAPVTDAWSDIPTAAAVKYLAGRTGLDIGEPLPPLPELTDPQRARLGDCYEAVSDHATGVGSR